MEKEKSRGAPGLKHRGPSGEVKEKIGEPPHRRTKWSPQAKWRPAEVGGGESRGAPRTGGPSGLLRSDDQPKSVVEKVGSNGEDSVPVPHSTSSTRRSDHQMGTARERPQSGNLFRRVLLDSAFARETLACRRRHRRLVRNTIALVCTKNSTWVLQQPTVALCQSARIEDCLRGTNVRDREWTSSRQGCLSCRRRCTPDRKGQVRAASRSGIAQELECLSPLEDCIVRHVFSQDISHVLLAKHTRHSFGAPLPEVPLLTCQGWSVNSGARYPPGPRDWRLPRHGEAPSPAHVAWECWMRELATPCAAKSTLSNRTGRLELVEWRKKKKREVGEPPSWSTAGQVAWAKWRPAEVGGGESRGAPRTGGPRVSSGQALGASGCDCLRECKFLHSAASMGSRHMEV